MPTISEKELGSISDQLNLETSIIAKYQYYAKQTQDNVLRTIFNNAATEHQKHYDALCMNLK